MKRIIIGTLAVMIAMPVVADDTPATGDKTTTSQPYVKTQVDLKQGKIPATGTNTANAGSTVVMYTGQSGEIGERELFTGGEYTAGTDADKLITASALNNAMTTLPETPTTTLECANPGTCTLWTIVDQTAYGISGDGTTTTVDLTTLIGNVAGTGYTSNDSSGADYDTYNMSNTIISGEPLAFAVDYGDKGMIKGHGRCSSRGVTHPWYNNSYTFESDHFTSTLPDSSGQYCYCTLESYTPLNGSMTGLSAPWVFNNDYGDASDCAYYCANFCAYSLQLDGTLNLAFRAAVFGSLGASGGM